MANKTKSVFDIKDVKYTNLKGEIVQLPIDLENLASTLHDNATTLGVHVFSEELYKTAAKLKLETKQQKKHLKRCFISYLCIGGLKHSMTY